MNKNTKPLSLDALFAFADTVEVLDRLPRAGYVMRGVSQPQSVASHNWGVCLWTLLLAERMPERGSLDMRKALTMATLHEVGEARLMDIPHPTRLVLGAQVVSDAERKIVRSILRDMPAAWLAAWEEFEDAKTLEARMVKAADKLELMHRILMYEKFHNGRLDEFWTWEKNFRWEGIPAARTLFNAMKRRHRANGRKRTSP